MSSQASRVASFPMVLIAAPCLALALAGCLGVAGLERSGQPAPIAAASPERAAAVAEMRAQAEAGNGMPFPNTFPAEQTARLAAREEPRPVAEVQAIQAELTLIAEQRAATSDASTIAALDKRAKELRRLALAAQPLRR